MTAAGESEEGGSRGLVRGMATALVVDPMAKSFERSLGTLLALACLAALSFGAEASRALRVSVHDDSQPLWEEGIVRFRTDGARLVVYPG